MPKDRSVSAKGRICLRHDFWRELAASVAFTHRGSVFSRNARPNLLHPRHPRHPRSIPSPFPGPMILIIEGQRPGSIPALGNAQGSMPHADKGLKARHQLVRWGAQMDRAFSPRVILAADPRPTLVPPSKSSWPSARFGLGWYEGGPLALMAGCGFQRRQPEANRTLEPVMHFELTGRDGAPTVRPQASPGQSRVLRGPRPKGANVIGFPEGRETSFLSANGAQPSQPGAAPQDEAKNKMRAESPTHPANVSTPADGSRRWRSHHFHPHRGALPHAGIERAFGPERERNNRR